MKLTAREVRPPLDRLETRYYPMHEEAIDANLNYLLRNRDRDLAAQTTEEISGLRSTGESLAQWKERMRNERELERLLYTPAGEALGREE